MNKQKLIQCLLEIGANTEYVWLLDKLKFDNNTVLTYASRCGHINIVKYLVENGCNPNYGTLEWASIYGHFNIVKYLIENNCNHNINVASELASYNGHYEIVEYLKNEQTKANTKSS